MGEGPLGGEKIHLNLHARAEREGPDTGGRETGIVGVLQN